MLGGVNVFVAWRVQCFHRLAGPVFAPLGGPSVCAAWRAQCLRRLAGPVLTPLGGSSICTAWRAQCLRRLAGPVFSPLDGPVFTPLGGSSVYAAWRLCPRHLHHQQATTFAFLQEDLRAFFQFDFAAGRDGGFALYVVALR